MFAPTNVSLSSKVFLVSFGFLFMGLRFEVDLVMLMYCLTTTALPSVE